MFLLLTVDIHNLCIFSNERLFTVDCNLLLRYNLFFSTVRCFLICCYSFPCIFWFLVNKKPVFVFVNGVLCMLVQSTEMWTMANSKEVSFPKISKVWQFFRFTISKCPDPAHKVYQGFTQILTASGPEEVDPFCMLFRDS
jgi:hypothetical protein